jgi:predicted O-methyltransferase YrrM
MLTKLRHALSSRLETKPSQVTIDAIVKGLYQEAVAQDRAIPQVELTARHIQNLRVVIDRDAFLELLPKKSIVAEIGVAEGVFSAQILAITTPRVLHLIDSWTHDLRYASSRDQVTAKFAQQVADGQVVIHEGLSTAELAKFADGYFDWVYLDTSHDYESTRQELELCRAKVKKGGLITGHDFVTGYWIGHYRYGVIEAVHAFCIQNDWELICLTHETHRHLSFAIRPISPGNP